MHKNAQKFFGADKKKTQLKGESVASDYHK